MPNEIKPEQVPMPVASAIRSYILQHGYNTNPTELAAAALNAWPGKTIHNDHCHWPEWPHIILPLTPQENEND